MGDLAVFEIGRCKDSNYHITEIYIRHPNHTAFFVEFAKLRYLNRILLSDRTRSDYLDETASFHEWQKSNGR